MWAAFFRLNKFDKFDVKIGYHKDACI